MTYANLLWVHSWTRYVVVLALLLAVGMAAYGLLAKRSFSPLVNSVRHWTATIAHIQLIIGVLLYFKSPLVQFFWSENADSTEVTFFGSWHALLMLVAIVVLTIGSAKAKRRPTDGEQYQTMFWWFLAALILIFMAIPWPFMPWAARPYLRPF